MEDTIRNHRIIVKGKYTSLRCVIELGSIPGYYITTAFSQPAGEQGMRISNHMTPPEGEQFIKGLKHDLAYMRGFAEQVIELYKDAYLDELIKWHRSLGPEDGGGE